MLEWIFTCCYSYILMHHVGYKLLTLFVNWKLNAFYTDKLGNLLHSSYYI